MAKYAKRKSHKKTAHSRRRSIGAMALSPSSPLVKLAPIALGYFFADKLNTPIDTAVGGKVDSKIIAAGQVGIGFLLAFKGKKSLAKSIIGGVLIGAGLKRGLKDFGVVTGFYDVPVLSGRRGMNGFHDVPVIGAYKVPAGGRPGMGGYRVPSTSKVMNGCSSDNGSGSGINPNSR